MSVATYIYMLCTWFYYLIKICDLSIIYLSVYLSIYLSIHLSISSVLWERLGEWCHSNNKEIYYTYSLKRTRVPCRKGWGHSWAREMTNEPATSLCHNVRRCLRTRHTHTDPRAGFKRLPSDYPEKICMPK